MNETERRVRRDLLLAFAVAALDGDRALVFNYLTNRFKVIHTNMWGL